MDTKLSLRTDLKFSPEYLPCGLDLIPRNIPQMQVDMEYMKPRRMWSAAMRSWELSQSSLAEAPQIWQIRRYLRPGMKRTIDIMTLDYEMQVQKDLNRVVEQYYKRESAQNYKNQMHDVPQLIQQTVLLELRDHLHQMFMQQPVRALMMTTTKPQQEYLEQDPWAENRRNHFRTIYHGPHPQNWEWTPEDSEMYLYINSKIAELLEATRQEVQLLRQKAEKAAKEGREFPWEPQQHYWMSRMSVTETLVNLPSLSEEEEEATETEMMKTLFRISQQERPIPSWIPLGQDKRTSEIKIRKNLKPEPIDLWWEKAKIEEPSKFPGMIPEGMTFQDLITEAENPSGKILPKYQKFLTEAAMYQLENMMMEPQTKNYDPYNVNLMFPIRIKMNQPSVQAMDQMLI